MIVGVKEMLLELHRKLHSTAQDLQFICRWQFQGRQHSDVVRRRARTLASKYCADFYKPVRRLWEPVVEIFNNVHGGGISMTVNPP